MSNSIKERPLDPIFAELQRMGAAPNGPLWEFVRFIVQAGDKTLTTKGEIQSVAPVKGRTEGIGTTIQNLDISGNFAIDHLNDSVNFAKVSTSALNGNQVDLSKAGVINQAPTSKMVNNSMLNSSNNATIDSIDNGTNATIRVYGTSGGPGTTWNLTIGPLTQPNLPSFSGAFNYSTDYIVYWDGSSFHVIPAANAFPALADNISFTGVVHTVAAGGAGGVSGGGQTTGGNKGRLTAIQ